MTQECSARSRKHESPARTGCRQKPYLLNSRSLMHWCALFQKHSDQNVEGHLTAMQLFRSSRMSGIRPGSIGVTMEKCIGVPTRSQRVTRYLPRASRVLSKVPERRAGSNAATIRGRVASVAADFEFFSLHLQREEETKPLSNPPRRLC
jgi:hypothetical protein